MQINSSNNLSFGSRFDIPYKALDLESMNGLRKTELFVERILTHNPSEAFQISSGVDSFKRSTSKGFISDEKGQKVFDIPDNEDGFLIQKLNECFISFEQMLGTK